METKVYHWIEDNQNQIAIEASRLLDGGGLVAIPTETVYGIACRAHPETIGRLDAIKCRSVGKRYSLHIASPSDIARYVPKLNPRAAALARKGLPGPITLICRLDKTSLELQEKNLGQKVFSVLYEDGTIGIRCPDCQPAIAILSQTVWPIVAPSANPSGKNPAVSASQVAEYFDGQIEMIVDGQLEACRYQQSSTVVEIAPDSVQVLREGVLTKQDIERLSTVKILFVCTGNTCRSPMAEGLCKKYLADKLGCHVDELEINGYSVESSGTSAYDGIRVSQEAAEACRPLGVVLDGHRSRQLMRRDVADADFIFVMGNAHRQAVLSLCEDAAARCFLLDKQGDIPDPVGLGTDVYRHCMSRIKKALELRMNELL